MTQPMVEAGRKTGTSKPPTAGFNLDEPSLGLVLVVAHEDR